MTSVFLPVRVVVFASEQLFPTLQFLLHAADRFGPELASVHIYCTTDDRRSGAPARRLQSVIERWGRSRGMSFDIYITTGDMWPAGVRIGLTNWFEAAPTSRWLVNVTGGTKPMSAAATELTLATDLVSRRVIYQEIDGRWVELVTGDDGLLEAQPLDSQSDAVVPQTDTLERLLPVSDLVATQFSEDHHVSVQRLKALPVDTALSEVMSRQWRWKDGLAALTKPVAANSNGDAFERFIGAGLLDCGLRLGHSLKVTDSAAAGKVAREVDLVGCHRGRLICIDIKLPGAEEHAKGTQLADVAELAHSLGGRGALAIALRPGWSADPDIGRLAKALGVRLLTQDDAAYVFTRLLGWIDTRLQLGTAARAAEQLLQTSYGQGNDVLSDGRLVGAKVEGNGIVHLPQVIEHISERRSEPWGLVELTSGQYWMGVPKKNLPAHFDQGWGKRFDLLKSTLFKLAIPDSPFICHESKAWVLAQLTLRSGVKGDDLRAAVRQVLT